MARALINGREVRVPDLTSAEEIKKAGKIKNDRTLIHRKREGNFVVHPGKRLNVNDGDTFTDAPARIKGC